MAKLAKTVHKIRKELFAHMEKLPVSYFDKHSHGDLMSTFTNDVDMLNQTLEQSVSQIIISVVSVVGSFGMMLYLSPLLTVMVVVMLVVMFASIRYIGQKSAKNFRAQQAALADINGYIEEMMTGQKVVKVFNYEKRAIKTFKEKNEELRKASTDASAYGVMLMPIMGNLSYVMYALVSMFELFGDERPYDCRKHCIVFAIYKIHFKTDHNGFQPNEYALCSFGRGGKNL